MRCITLQEANANRNRIATISSLMPKIEWAKLMIKYALGHSDNPIIAFSGGKDSLVVLHLVRQVKKDVPGLFGNTLNEYAETVEYVREIDNIHEVTPEKTFWQCVKEYGLPGVKSKAKRHGNQCCNWLKEKPSHKFNKQNDVDLTFMGLTMSESRNRFMMLKRMGPYYWHKAEKLHKCHPIYDWTVQDVWDYIDWFKLSYNPIYDMGIPRCGCRFCTAYLSWEETTALYDPRDTKLLLNYMKKQSEEEIK